MVYFAKSFKNQYFIFLSFLLIYYYLSTKMAIKADPLLSILKPNDTISANYISSEMIVSSPEENLNLSNKLYQYNSSQNEYSDQASNNNYYNNNGQNNNNEMNLYDTLFKLYYTVKFWRELYIFFGTILTICGSTLNTLCIVIFYKSKLFRNSSFPYYVYVISIVDTFNIFFRFAIPQTIENIIRKKLVKNYNLTSYDFDQEKIDNYTSLITSDYHCGVFIYIYNSLTLVSVWLMAAVSLERWLVIKFALQTKFTIKLRACLILLFIFISIFTLNIFDLAPGFYIKPQWYANLTLLCERDDSIQNNTSRIYKQLGAIKFNTDIFAFVRTLLQSIIPFLVVLIFNSSIIYNFKQIKSAVFARGKSNSCVSVASGASCSGNYIGRMGADANAKISNNPNVSDTTQNLSSVKNRNKLSDSSNFSHKRRFQRNSSKRRGQISEKPCTIALSNSRDNNNLNIDNSSRSPSPFNLLNTAVTPTSLVSALNLADGNRDCEQQMRLCSPTIKVQNLSPTAPTTPTELDITRDSSLNSNNDNFSSNKNFKNKFLQVKQLSNSYLMPPTYISQHKSDNFRHDSGSSSIGTTNSSANLSMATTSNITTTILLNNSNVNSSSANNNGSMLSGVDGCDKLSLSQNPNKSSSSSISNIIKRKCNITTLSTPSINNNNANNNRVSFKRRTSRVKLNRETDIMLIVLSFSILLSQLPFTIAWYLIYYQNILEDYSTRFEPNVYTSAHTPMVLYLIRILEMIYYSLNFLFYITLSPSLRREIANYTNKLAITNLFLKYFKRKPQGSHNELKNKSKNKNNSTTGNRDDDNFSNGKRTPSPSGLLLKKNKSNLRLKVNNDNSLNNKSPALTPTEQNSEFYINSSNVAENSKMELSIPNNYNENSLLNYNKRLYSNSSGEYMDYLDKMRSISPIRRPTTFVLDSTENFNKESTPNNKDSSNTDINTSESNKRESRLLLKKLFQFRNNYKNNIDESNINKKNSNNSSNLKSSKIKIIIDNYYNDEETPNEEEFKIDDEIMLDKLEYSSSYSSTAAAGINANQSLVKNNNQTNRALNGNNRMFNLSSPSFLNSLNIHKSNNNNNSSNKFNKNDIIVTNNHESNKKGVVYL